MHLGEKRKNFMQGKHIGQAVKLFHNTKTRFARRCRNFINRKRIGEHVKLFSSPSTLPIRTGQNLSSLRFLYASFFLRPWKIRAIRRGVGRACCI